MSIHCNPKIVSKNLLVYLDAANKKSYPKYSLEYWGDISDQGNHFTMYGNLVNDTNSFLFPGNTSNYFYSAEFDNHPINELTVEMWVLPDLNSNGDVFYSFIHSENDMVSIIHSISISNQLNLVITGPNFNIETDVSILDNTWKHLVRTSSRNTGVEKIYVNGILKFEDILNPTNNFNENGVILLGEKPNIINGVLDSDSAYSGELAIFKIYTKVLTEDEIKQNFNALKGKFIL